MLLLSFHLHFKLWNYNFTFPGSLLGSGGKCLPGRHFKIIAYKIRISCTFLRKISSISFFPSVLLRVSWVWRSAFTWKMAQSFLLQIRISRTFLKIHLISFFFFLPFFSFLSVYFYFVLFFSSTTMPIINGGDNPPTIDVAVGRPFALMNWMNSSAP